MDYAGNTRVFVAGALFVAAFVGTLLLSISVTKESRHDGKAQAPIRASAAQPPGAIEATQGPATAPPLAEVSVDELLPKEEYEDRTWAIDELAASPSAASIEALGQVLASSGDYRERLEAVDALQRIGSSGEFAESARQALQPATMDRNAQVAARARAALAPYETPRN
jgi:hypothetical protein